MLTRALFTVALPVLFLASSANADPNATPSEPSATSDPSEASDASLGAHLHAGFYFREALGVGFSSLSADGPFGRTVMTSGIPGLPTADGLVLLGGTPARGLVLGAGFQEMSMQGYFRGGAHDRTSANGEELTVGPFVDYYPDPAGGFHVGALVGLSGALVTGGGSEMSLSLGGTIFGGYDWFVGRQTSVGVMAFVSGATPSSLVDTSGNDTGYRIAPLSATLAFTFLVH